MRNFEQSYCSRHRCTPAGFRRRLFWATLYPHARLVAPVLMLGDYFKRDHELIAACGQARSMQEVLDELHEHRFHPAANSWLRYQLAIRVSRGRLRQLAQRYLTEAGPG